MNRISTALYAGIAVICAFTATAAAAAAADATQPAGANKVVYLVTKDDLKYSHTMPALDCELYRQAFLIAARDGVGLQTRDQSLREWHDAPPADATWTFGSGMDRDTLTTPAGAMVWHDILFVVLKPQDLSNRLAKTESMSRSEFVKDLRANGYAGAGDADKPGAAAPADAEARLRELDDLSQIAVLRETHALIHSDGESEARLGVLVRGYANLGQLTRFHWSVEHDVFAARSLLYAQRMVAKDPNSATALWHRAYAEAMAGWIGLARGDLAAAAKRSAGRNPPAWVAVLDPLCRYDFRALGDLAAKDDALAPLASYCAFLTIEISGCQAATLNVEQSALAANPKCLRLIDAMCDITGPGMLNDLADEGPQILSQLLGNDLEHIPGLPAEIIQTIHQLKRPGGNPQGRETICQSLIADGAPANDPVELSWAVLGRDIQETTFAQVRQKASLIAVQWGVDASDYVDQVQPLIAEHPMKAIIDAYGAFHETTMDDAADALRGLPWQHLNPNEFQLFQLEQSVQSHGPGTMINLAAQFESELDECSFDREAWLVLYASMLQGHATEDTVYFLSIVSPDSPWITCSDILNHWDPSKASQWEQSHGHYPSIQMALGKRYAQLKQWTDAQRCFKHYLEASPDLAGYEEIAKLYQSQKRDDLWLATLQDFLTETQPIALEHAQVQKEIADYYMQKGQYQDALPYADAAAQSGSGWGLLSAARAHTGVGDFDGAEQLYIEEYQHYDASPYPWYAWCMHTGHGHPADAAKAMAQYFNSHSPPSDEDLLQKAFVDYTDGKTTDAMSELQQRLDHWPGPLSAVHLAVFADEAHQPAVRDRALRHIGTIGNVDMHLVQFAHVLAAAYHNTASNPALNLSYITTLTNEGDANARIVMNYLTAKYLSLHGQKDQAVEYVKRCYFGFGGYDADLLLADQFARQLGLDPIALDRDGRPDMYPIALSRAPVAPGFTGSNVVARFDLELADGAGTPNFSISDPRWWIIAAAILAPAGLILLVFSLARYGWGILNLKGDVGVGAVLFLFGAGMLAASVYAGKTALERRGPWKKLQSAFVQQLGRSPDSLDLKPGDLYNIQGDAECAGKKYKIRINMIAQNKNTATYQLHAQLMK